MEGEDKYNNAGGGQFQNVEQVTINNILVEKRRMISKAGTDINNGISLNLDTAFGNYQYPIRKNSYFISEDDMIYICGKHIVSYNLIRKRQSFIQKNSEDEQVTTMNYYYGKRGSTAKVAVGLQSSSKILPMIRVYFVASYFSYNLIHSHLKTDVNIIHCCFFHKGKYLASLTEIDPLKKYVLTIWHVEKEKIITTLEIFSEVVAIEVCPTDTDILSIAGKAYFKLFKMNLQDKTQNEMAEESKTICDEIKLGQNIITDHTWIKDTSTCVITTRFEIFVFKEYKLDQQIDYEFPEDEVTRVIDETKPSYQHDTQKKQTFDAVLKFLNRKTDNELVLKISKKGSVKSLDSENSLRDSQEEEELAPDDEEEEEEDDDLQDVLDNIRNSRNSKEVLINLIKKALWDTNLHISCVCSRSNGFAIGLNGTGLITLFSEGPEGKFILHSSSKINNQKNLNIQSLASSNDDTYIAVNVNSLPRFLPDKVVTGGEKNDDKKDTVKGTQGGEISSAKSRNHLDLYIFNSAIVDAIKFTYKEPFEPLFEKGAHSGSILSIGLCPTKTIVGSLCDDKTVKFWNFSAEQKLMLSFSFHENEMAFDIHPLSLQCAIGYKEGLKIYFLLEEELRVTYENFSKPCSALKYSEGGQWLAAGYSNHITIMDAYTMENLRTLTGHSTFIKDLIWLSRDKKQLTSCHNGNVNVWNITLDWSKDLEHFISNKNTKYHGIAYDPEFDLLVCCCSDMKVRTFNEKGVNLLIDYDSSPICFTSVIICKKKKVICFGTSIGSVRVYQWPFTSKGKENLEYIESAIHQEPTTILRFTYDYEYLVSASSDGSQVFSKVKEFVNGEDISTVDFLAALSHQKDNDLLGRISNTFNFSEFCLLSSSTQEMRREKIKELDFKIQNTKSDIEEQKEKIVNFYNEKIQKLEEKNKAELMRQKEFLASIMEEADSNQKKIAIDIDDQKQKLNQMIDTLENEHREQLLILYDDNDNLNDQIGKFGNEMEERVEDVNGEFERVMSNIQTDYQKKYNDIHQKYKMAIFNLKIDQKKFQEALIQTEKEYYEDLTETKKNLTEQLEREKKTAEELRSLNSKLSKENEKNKERDLNLDNLIHETKSQNEQLSQEIRLFKEKCSQMQLQLNEQEKVINIKEMLIRKFRTKNYHLQNYKSVYDHQVTTLKEEHEPLTEYVDNLERHIKRMYNELQSEADSHKALRNNAGSIDDKINSLKKDIITKNDFLSKTRRKLEVFEHDLSQMVTDKDKGTIRKKLKVTLDEYISHTLNVENMLASSSNEAVNSIMESKKMQSLEKLSSVELQSIKEELLRQRDMMSKKLISTTEINKRLEKERDNVFKSIQEEGKMLINKCNELRKYGLLLKYRIGIARNDAEELANEMANNYAGSFKPNMTGDKSKFLYCLKTIQLAKKRQ